MTDKFGSHNLEKVVWREDMPEFILDMMRKRLTRKLSWNFGFKGRLIPIKSLRAEDIDTVENVSCILLYQTLRTRVDTFLKEIDTINTELEKWSNYFGKSFPAKIDPHAAQGVTHVSPSWYTEPLVPRLQSRHQFPELEFHTAVWRQKKVALYSLTDLLGEEQARILIEGSKYEKEHCVILTAARHNVPVEILLMQLQAYLAKPGA